MILKPNLLLYESRLWHIFVSVSIHWSCLINFHVRLSAVRLLFHIVCRGRTLANLTPEHRPHHIPGPSRVLEPPPLHRSKCISPMTDRVHCRFEIHVGEGLQERCHEDDRRKVEAMRMARLVHPATSSSYTADKWTSSSAQDA